MYSAKVIAPRARMRAIRASRSSGTPARRAGRADLGRAHWRAVRFGVGRDVLGRLPVPRGGQLFLREDGDAEALVGRKLEVRRLAERAVRADLDAVPAVDAAHDVELVGLQV